MAHTAALALAVLALAALELGPVSANRIGNRGGQLRIKENVTGKSARHSAEFKHRLRICNAYPLSEAVDVYEEDEKLTNESISYKSCHEMTSPVEAGDKLQFRIGGVRAGSFAVSELPGNDAVLVLVIYRRDITSTAVAFESHVFANLINAQIAVLDTYRGAKKEEKATLRVQDASSAKTSRSEELRFDSVVSVNQGIYEVVLSGEDGEPQAKQELVALNRESYVVVRCGVEEEDGQGYPQELMVYPHSDAKVLMGSAVHSAGGLTLLAWVLVLVAAAVGGQ